MIAIFFRDDRLAFLSDEITPEAALKAFNAAHNIDPWGQGLDSLSDLFSFYTVNSFGSITPREILESEGFANEQVFLESIQYRGES
mgnify:CR=1 FL=1